MNLNRFTGPLWDLDTFHLREDFWTDQVDTTFIDTVTDSGSVAINDAANGIATLTPSDGTVGDNDEAYFASPNELFLVAANRCIYGACRLQFSEANTNAANVFFGFANAIAANTLVDDGGGMRASGNIFAIHKIDGETVWRLTTRNGSAYTTTVSTTTAGGSAYQKLEIEIGDYDGVSVKVSAKVNGDYLRDSNNLVIRHTVLVTSSTEMQVGVGVKNGSTTLETLLVDYIYAAQTR